MTGWLSTAPYYQRRYTCPQDTGDFSALLDGVRLEDYLSSDLSLTNTDLLAYPDATTGRAPAAWPDASASVQKAFAAGRDKGQIVNGSNAQGFYLLDGPTAALIYQGTGFFGPIAQPFQLTYTTVNGVLKQQISNGRLVFIVDNRSVNRMTPKLARQAGTHVSGLQIAGFGAIEDVAAADVSGYPTMVIDGTATAWSPTDGAPVVCTDHKHNPDGSPTAQAKAGNTYLQAHIVGVMQGAYAGDPLVSEEPWAGSIASGNQTGLSFTEIHLSGFCLKRMLGTARTTGGGVGLKVRIKDSAPYWTAITQPLSGGLGGTKKAYALLKYKQQNYTCMAMWHRTVGFDIEIECRNALYGLRMFGGYNALGPASQDTGKYNAGTVKFNCERVITALRVDPDAYLHRDTFIYEGHYMDRYNMSGETRPVIDIVTDGTLAGAIDKAVYDTAVVSKDYAIDDKVSDAGTNVFSCITAGTATVVPTASGGNYDTGTKVFTDPGSSLRWIFRNGGFKPVGQSPFAISFHKGIIQEASGRVFRNTSADGHLFHDLTGLHFSNWSQAKANHADAAILNASSSVTLIHRMAQVSASGNSKRVYDVADPSNLFVRDNLYFGQDVPLDANSMPTGSPPAAIGGNLLPSFWEGTGCRASTAGIAQGDDDGDDGDG